MVRSARRILLVVEPGLLEGALATLLSEAFDGEVVQLGRARAGIVDRGFDAAVVSDKMPKGLHANVVITLPDTIGSGGVGTVAAGQRVEEVVIEGAEHVVELVATYATGHAEHRR